MPRTSARSRFLSLPHEILVEIASCLDLNDTFALATTCHEMHQTCCLAAGLYAEFAQSRKDAYEMRQDSKGYEAYYFWRCETYSWEYLNDQLNSMLENDGDDEEDESGEESEFEGDEYGSDEGESESATEGVESSGDESKD